MVQASKSGLCRSVSLKIGARTSCMEPFFSPPFCNTVLLRTFWNVLWAKILTVSAAPPPLAHDRPFFFSPPWCMEVNVRVFLLCSNRWSSCCTAELCLLLLTQDASSQVFNMNTTTCVLLPCNTFPFPLIYFTILFTERIKAKRCHVGSFKLISVEKRDTSWMSKYLVCGWDTDISCVFLQNAAATSDHDNRQHYLCLACFILHSVRPCLMFYWNDIHAFFHFVLNHLLSGRKDTKSTHTHTLSTCLSPELSLQSLPTLLLRVELMNIARTHALGKSDHISESVSYFDTADSWMLMEPQLKPNISVVTTQGVF